MSMVWESTLDGKYHCQVIRKSDGVGILSVVDTTSNKNVLIKEVPLSYNAIFGPDIADLQEWEELAIQAVDKG